MKHRKDFDGLKQSWSFHAPTVTMTSSEKFFRRSRAPRKPTLVSVARQASKAAIAVARYEVKPDGTVVVVAGKPDMNDLKLEKNEWDNIQ